MTFKKSIMSTDYGRIMVLIRTKNNPKLWAKSMWNPYQYIFMKPTHYMRTTNRKTRCKSWKIPNFMKIALWSWHGGSIEKPLELPNWNLLYLRRITADHLNNSICLLSKNKITLPFGAITTLDKQTHLTDRR